MENCTGKNIALFAAAITLFLIIMADTSAAEEKQVLLELSLIHEIRIGILAHDVDSLWSGKKKESGTDFNAEIILGRPKISFLFGTVSPNFGLSINNNGDTSKFYIGLLWERETEAGIFLNFGIGNAVHNGKLKTNNKDRKELGARILFRVPVEIGYSIDNKHRLSFFFDHVSNGNLASPNEGMDTLGIRYGYRF